jgi:hypothetical protein
VIKSCIYTLLEAECYEKMGFTLFLCCLFLVISLSGCEIFGGRGFGSPIQDEEEAEYIAESVVDTACETVCGKLPSQSQSFSNHRIDGSYGGYAIVNGTKSSTYNSGYSSVSSSSTIDISIQFDNWIVRDEEDSYGKIHGTVDYYYYHWSSTSASGGYSYYNSSLSKSIKNSAGYTVNVECYVKSYDEVRYNISDSITFSISDWNDNPYMLTGTVTGSKGTFGF